MTAAPLLVFSHLRWNFVFQRPQHLLTRLATRRPVYFIEEPILSNSEPHWRLEAGSPGLTVCEPHTPIQQKGFCDEQMQVLNALVRRLVVDHGLESPVLWFYSPMAVPLAADLSPQAIIYDCMDELSAFLHAPPQLLGREAELLQRADMVFTGGPSLYRAKKDRHPCVYCFPSSVDAAHFGKARPENQLAEPEGQRNLPHPRLGFFGVIDERLDIPLLAEVAKAKPDWQFCLVGPVVKIDPASLPRTKNIHYFGQQAYDQLPAFLSGWDVCLLPFARNAATRFISPTKTLEYMAAERPIVSTRITDVAEPYSEIVYLGDTPEEFLAACERALDMNAQEQDQRITLMRNVLAHTSWDQTAHAMDDLIGAAIAKRQAEKVFAGQGGQARALNSRASLQTAMPTSQ